MGGNGIIEEGPSLRKVQGSIKPKRGGLAHGDKYINVVVTMEGDCFIAEWLPGPCAKAEASLKVQIWVGPHCWEVKEGRPRGG